jgi:hypothetical protein
VLDLDHSVSRRICQASDRHSDGRGRIARRPTPKLEQIYVEPRIAVKEKEPLIELVARMPHGTAGSGAVRLDRDLNV